MYKVYEIFMLKFYLVFIGGDRKFVVQVRGVGMFLADVLEWKKYIIGGQKAFYGRKEKKFFLEQRQGFFIYKFKDELVKVWISFFMYVKQFIFFRFIVISIYFVYYVMYMKFDI